MNTNNKTQECYSLFWGEDLSMSEKFNDLSEALFAFDVALTNRNWNADNIDKPLFLGSITAKETTEDGEGLLPGNKIAVGIAAVDEDTEYFNNIDSFYVSAVNDTLDYERTVREKLQEISMDAYYVDILHKEEAA